MSASELKLRQPRFADDLWYSSDSVRLQVDLQSYFAGALPRPAGLIGLIAPHAGYYYSGHVAGAAFAGLTPHTFETVILIGPDHHGAAPGAVSTLLAATWRTPLGDIPVDQEFLQAIRAEFPLVILPADEEHALEVELPFLQTTLRQFNLVPLMMNDQSSETCRRLAGALVKVIHNQPASGKVLLVASSDLSHYFDDNTARHLDQATLDFILNLDAAGLIRHVEAGRRQGRPFACGAGPIAVVIYTATALDATGASLLKYATSADAHPRKDRVVGYAAVAISKETQ